MRVIIIGAGKVGYNIAQILASDNQDVVVIEQNEERARHLEESLDVQVVIGSGASCRTLEEAGIKEASLLVAVTEIDEVNMIACMMAKQYGVLKTIARVRNPEYVEDNKLNKGAISGIDLIINPELVTAKEIAKLIEVPEALDVVYYADGKIQLLELKIPGNAPVAGKKMRELKFNCPFLIVAIVREGQMIIPRGDDVVLPEDIIFILGKTKEMLRIERFLGTERQKAERVMILGGDLTGYHLARILEERKISVKVIEKDYKRCMEISKHLGNTLVLHGDGTDLDLLKEEGAGETDVFVCLTDDDKLNLLVALLSKHLGAKRTIVQVRRSDYISLMESVGVDVGISPRILTANAILKFIRRGGNVVSVTLLSQAQAEMMELVVSPESKVVNKKLKELVFPAGAIIGSIYRNNQVIVPTGEDCLKSGDTVTVFALPKAISRVEEYFTAN